MTTSDLRSEVPRSGAQNYARDLTPKVGSGDCRPFTKINICYRLGLLSAEFTRALHIVRRIRNAFAHELSGAHLDSGPQADRVNALLFPLRPMPFFGKFRRFFFGNDPSVSSDFKACLALMAGRLQGLLSVTETISGFPPANFILAAWREEQEEPRAEIAGTQN